MHNQETDQFETITDVTQVFTKPNSFFAYYDPSPLLPSALLKNHLVKLNHYYQQLESAKDGDIFTLRILSIRDKISKLTDVISLTETFYLEVKFTKLSSAPEQLKLK